jgi:hypothetical protein
MECKLDITNLRGMYIQAFGRTDESRRRDSLLINQFLLINKNPTTLIHLLSAALGLQAPQLI